MTNTSEPSELDDTLLQYLHTSLTRLQDRDPTISRAGFVQRLWSLRQQITHKNYSGKEPDTTAQNQLVEDLLRLNASSLGPSHVLAVREHAAPEVIADILSRSAALSASTRTYTHLQLAAFRIRADVPWHRRLYMLRFPESWKRALSMLSLPCRDASEIRSFPVALLNQIITALLPGVTAVVPSAKAGEQAPWIYSDIVVRTESLFALIATWIRANSADKALAEATLGTLSHTDLQWEPLEIDFATLTCKSGMDTIDTHTLYRLLPHILATELTAPGVRHEHLTSMSSTAGTPMSNAPAVGQVVSEFHRYPTPQGTTLVNWPPHQLNNQPLSLCINITVHSRPFSSEPLIHLAVYTRWWKRNGAMREVDPSHTVDLLPSRAWLHAPYAEDEIERSGDATGATIGQILQEIGLDDRLPETTQLKTPVTRLTTSAPAGQGRQKNSDCVEHPVTQDTALADKVPLVDWVAKNLAHRLTPVEALSRAAAAALDANALRNRKYSKISDAAQLRQAIADTVGGTIRIEIFYNTELTKRQAHATLSKLLGIDVPDDATRIASTRTIADTDELTIVTSVRPVGSWGNALSHEKSTMITTARLRTAVTRRSDEIIKELGASDVPTISLVEIAPHKSDADRQDVTDLQFAIRTGLARTGRLSQFVASTPSLEQGAGDRRLVPTPASRHKLVNSWYDLLRQLGINTHDLHLAPAKSSITTPPAYLAFWVIRQNNRGRAGTADQVPIAVLIDPTGRTAEVCTPGRTWLPLHRAQHEISRQHVLTDSKRTTDEIIRFFETVLLDVIDNHASVLLLTCAQNLRSGWPQLTNPELRKDHVKFGQRSQDISRYPGLRHVQVRTNRGGEVPDSYAVKDQATGNTPGLWTADERIYFSTGATPLEAITHKTTSKAAWNPGVLECTVVGLQPGDVAADWATLTHDLRWAAPHREQSEAYPWPLAMASQLTQYVVPKLSP